MMLMKRRDFLKAGAAAGAMASLYGCAGGGQPRHARAVPHGADLARDIGHLFRVLDVALEQHDAADGELAGEGTQLDRNGGTVEPGHQELADLAAEGSWRHGGRRAILPHGSPAPGRPKGSV